MEEHTEFSEELKRVVNDYDIPEEDYFTPKVLEDTYFNMDITLPIGVEVTKFSKVTIILRDENGTPIGRYHENTMLDMIVYEVKYLDGNKALLAANNITENIPSQVDEEENIFVLFD